MDRATRDYLFAIEHAIRELYAITKPEGWRETLLKLGELRDAAMRGDEQPAAPTTGFFALMRDCPKEYGGTR
jgi:hypothetical protein